MAVPAATVVLLLSISVVSSKTISGKENSVNSVFDDKAERGPRVKEDVTWPGFPYLKQVSAVSVDGNGNLHVFHRADRVWDSHTFDRTYRLVDTERGPIPNDTVLVIDTSNGKILYSWGANRFYMPHGLTVDYFGNTWVTDVGLHQVFMFPSPEGNPDLMIGDPFIPGAGKNHLCQPSDVAVLRSGHFFVSDGYCNSRILMFSPGGRLLKEIGSKDGMLVPHSLTLVPEHHAVCVADRENGRVLCYSTGMDESESGKLLATIENQGLGRVFAIDTRGKQLFLVNGPDLWQNSQSVSSDHGLVLDIESGLPMTLWGPDKGFRLPHDLAVSPDGKYVYVSEIDLSAQKRVYKFNIWD
ncbi:peptidyl-alpha-hydroxyglycine alpha-amidating lyase 2-like [Argiope bruennichi]|uniref:peptidylamidoglycolate lyase n=1 Tax=Argiope bruennichi TaxID=94029 RepID=A0A8T0EX43_ARGBR|nr:peptidyl-alpha-hydroxyglycine alpha-amidating lyase 2-like [Argiope bruennichi]KAF8778946.1 Peptidyl-alpha-hydroxyglycine alpha-amidating like protein [Argiope bruennichi]